MFVLADDLSSDLVPYMRHVQALQREGTSFDRYVVTDSLCCPSRASILTGRYPHSTGVIRNQPPDGGFDVFHAVAEESTFATSLQAAGYRTALMGKYLNGYTPGGSWTAAALRAAGLDGLGGRPARLPRLQLQPAGRLAGDEPPRSSGTAAGRATT